MLAVWHKQENTHYTRGNRLQFDDIPAAVRTLEAWQTLWTNDKRLPWLALDCMLVRGEVANL